MYGLVERHRTAIAIVVALLAVVALVALVAPAADAHAVGPCGAASHTDVTWTADGSPHYGDYYKHYWAKDYYRVYHFGPGYLIYVGIATCTHWI